MWNSIDGAPSFQPFLKRLKPFVAFSRIGTAKRVDQQAQAQRSDDGPEAAAVESRGVYWPCALIAASTMCARAKVARRRLRSAGAEP